MIAAIFSLVLAQTPEPACALSDHRCAAKKYLAKKGDRVQWLYLAHREYLFLFDEEHQPEILCQAREVLAKALAVKPTPADFVDRLKKSSDDAAKREREAGVICPVAQRKRVKRTTGTRSSDEPPPFLVTRTNADPRQHEERVVPQEPSVETPPVVKSTERAREFVPPEPEIDPGLPVRRSPPTRRSPVAADARPARSLVIAGGVTLAMSLGLAGAAVHTGNRMNNTRREQWDLWSSVDGYANDDLLAQDAALHRRDQALRSATLGLALTSAATTVVGAVLVSVGARRMVRTASRAAFLPAPGGFVLQARF